MSESEQDSYRVPVFGAMTKSRSHFVSSVRTTTCDIMCTSNSAVPETSQPPPPPSEAPLMATLPYDKISQSNTVGHKKGSTLFQKFRAGENTDRKNSDLRKERDDFMLKLFIDKKERDNKLFKAAVMIQKIFRGYRSRPRNYSYIPKKKRKKVFNQNELHDILCEMAGNLDLKPIPGLNLESRVKASKRKQKIENAAAFIIQRFFKMIFQRGLALVVVKTRKVEVINKSACVITRAIRFLKTRNFIKKAESVKKGRCTLKIQCAFRRWVAYRRVRELRKKWAEMRIKNDAAIIVQRNFSSKSRGELSIARATLLTIRSWKRMNRIAFDEFTNKLLNEIIDSEVRAYIPRLSNALVTSTDKVMIQIASDIVEEAWLECTSEFMVVRLKEMEEERRRIEEERLAVEETLLMSSEEHLMRCHLADLEAQKRDAERAIELRVDNLTEGAVNMIIDRFFDGTVVKRVAEYALQKYKEEVLAELEERKRIEIVRKQAFEDFVQEKANSSVDIAMNNYLYNFVHKAEVEKMILEIANGIVDDSAIAAVSVCTDTYSVYARELESLNADVTVSPSLVETYPVESIVESLEGSTEFEPSIAIPDFATAVESQVAQQLEDVQNAGGEEMEKLIDDASEAMSSKDEDSVAASERRETVTNHVKDTAELFARAKYQEAIAALDPVITELEGMMQHVQSTDVSTGKEIKFKILISVSRLLKARALQALGSYDSCKVELDRVLSDRESALGSSNYLVAEVCLYIAEWYRAVGNYMEAENAIKKADDIMMDELSITEKEEEGKRMITSTFFKLMHRIKITKCELLRNLGQYYKAQEALKQVQKSLARYKALGLISFEVQEEFHVSYINSIILRGKYSNALTLHKELLEKRRAHYGERHPKIASSMDSIGRLHLARSDMGEAAQFLENSMVLRYEIYPPDHPAIAASHLSKAEAFCALGKFGDAFTEATRSLQLFHEKFGIVNQYHPSVARALIVLSKIHVNLGEPLLAMQAADDSIKIFKACWGITELHRRTMDGLEALAESCIAQKSFLAAKEYLKQVITKRDTLHQIFGAKSGIPHELAFCKFLLCYCEVLTVPTASIIIEQMKEHTKTISQVTGNRHTVIARCLFLLSEVCKLKGGHADAKSYVGFAYDMLVGLHGEEHPIIALVLAECADNLRIPGFYDEALDLCNNALNLAQKVLHMDQNTLLAQVLMVKGQILSDMQRYNEAEDLLLHAMNMVLAKAGDSSAFYGIIVGHIAELYRRKRKIALAERNFVSALQVGQVHCGLQSMAFLEMAMNYALSLMDMKQWFQAFEILHRDVEPQLLSTLGQGHIWTLFVQANGSICAQIDDLLNGHVSLPILEGIDGSISSETILSQSLQHPAVQNFLTIWKQAGFGTEHPWFYRFQRIESLIAAESDMHSDGQDGQSVGFSMASYPTRRDTVASRYTEDNGSASSWISGTMGGASENDNESLGSLDGTVSIASKVDRSPRVVGSSVSGNGSESLLPTESSQYSASAALSAVLSVSKSSYSKGSGVPLSSSIAEESNSNQVPLNEDSVTSSSVSKQKNPYSLRKVLDRQPSYLSYNSHMLSARSNGTPRSLVSFAESQDRTASYASPGDDESPRSTYTGKSGYGSFMTPSTVRSRLHNLEDSHTSAQFESSIESSLNRDEEGTFFSDGDDNRSSDLSRKEGPRQEKRGRDSFTDYLNEGNRSTAGDTASYQTQSPRGDRSVEDEDHRSYGSYESESDDGEDDRSVSSHSHHGSQHSIGSKSRVSDKGTTKSRSPREELPDVKVDA